MPNIFISYRREDNPANARLLYERMLRAFPDDDVFMDVEGIGLGEHWRSVLEHHSSTADVLLIVIGKEWLNDDNGHRRIDDTNDVVRWEIRQFLNTRKRVIPVLVDGATPLQREDLPADLATLADCQAHTLSHVNFDNDVQDLIAGLRGQRKASELLAQLQNLLRVGKASMLIIASLGAALLALMWVNLFDLFGLDTRTANLTMLIGDVVDEVVLSDELLLVAIEPDAAEELGLTLSRRAQYARLIEQAAARGARAIAFDLTLTEPSPFDQILADAIASAGRQGTRVVFGFSALRGGKTLSIPELEESGALVGLTCVGERLEQATFATLALAAKGTVYGSFSLHAALTPAKIPQLARNADELSYVDRDGNERWIAFSVLQTMERPDKDCPAQSEGARVARLIIRLSHRERLRDPARRVSFTEALENWGNSNVLLDGKTIVVGAEHPLDRLRTRMDAEASRYGFEFHADAVNALLSGTVVQPASFFAQWFASLAIMAGVVLWRLSRLGKTGRLDVIVLSFACILVFTLIVVLYTRFGILVDGLYHVVALVVTWWILSAVERRWLDAG